MIYVNGCMQDNSATEGRKIIKVENYTFILQKVETYSININKTTVVRTFPVKIYIFFSKTPNKSGKVYKHTIN